MIPNLTLIDVRFPLPTRMHDLSDVVLSILKAKKFVESLPKVLKENVAKEDAEKLKKAFTDLGGVVVLE